MKNLKLTNNKLLRKVIALEKSLKIARKLNKDAKNETESARFMLEKATLTLKIEHGAESILFLTVSMS